MFCSKCGNAIHSVDNFCSQCGQAAVRSERNVIADIPIFYGNEALRNGDYLTAEQFLSHALEIECSFRVLIPLATVEKHLGKAVAAKTHLELARAHASSDEELGLVNYNLGNLLRETGHPREAIVFYTAAISCRSRHVGTHFNLAQALLSVGSFDEAIKEYKVVLQLDPTNPDAGACIEMALTAKEKGMGIPGF